jgi:3-deoxy-manno-octulosonate cytidylyltransferase (CMP-KDO synthetase)
MLVDIGGKPLIVHTFEKAVAANVGDVVVACDCEEVATQIRAVGGEAILTDPNLPSGTDRVFSAWTKCDLAGKYKFIINLQGDLPHIAPKFIQVAAISARNTEYDIFTLATPIMDDSYLQDSVVKPVIAFTSKDEGKALYFSRMAIPLGGPFFHHVGIYCFRSNKLRNFVNLPQGLLEKAERLEQLRALENNMTIGIRVIDADQPLSVDTLDDLTLARRYIEVSMRS